jgi:hypothetical protein
MAWQTTLIPVVRGLIFDLTPPYTYCDTRLEELIVVSAVLVTQECAFSTTYVMDLNAVTITPDPSADEDFVALVSIRTACLISQGEHRDAAKSAVSVKDGPSSIDTKDRAKHLGDIADDACSNYAKAKFSYQVGDGSVGKAIVGPYNSGSTPDTGRRFG